MITGNTFEDGVQRIHFLHRRRLRVQPGQTNEFGHERSVLWFNDDIFLGVPEYLFEVVSQESRLLVALITRMPIKRRGAFVHDDVGVPKKTQTKTGRTGEKCGR